MQTFPCNIQQAQVPGTACILARIEASGPNIGFYRINRIFVYKFRVHSSE